MSLLSMLSTLHAAVKLPPSHTSPPSSTSPSSPPSQQAPTSTEAATSAKESPVASASSSARCGHPDMSRRKQRNPKPFFNGNEGEEEDGAEKKAKKMKTEEEEEAEPSGEHGSTGENGDDGDDDRIGGHNDGPARSRSLSPKDTTADHRRSSLVNEGEAGADGSPPRRVSGSPQSAATSPSPRSGPPTPTAPHAEAAAGGGATDMASPPLMMPPPPLLVPPMPMPSLEQAPLGVKSVEENLAKNNLFFFGDVSVSNQPDVVPVPMIIPMVYLLPSFDDGGKQNVKYRMFIPLHPPEGPHPAPHRPLGPPSMPTLSVTISNQQQKQAKSPHQKTANVSDKVPSAPPSAKRDQTPLDLSKAPSEEGDEQDENDNASANGAEEAAAAANSSPGTVSPATRAMSPKTAAEKMALQQQREIEAHLNFLKVKHIEFLKNQQQEQQQQQQAKPESRCDECNINFSKHQNYLAHKKYYCSAGGTKPKTVPPPPLLPIEEEGEAASAASVPAPSSPAAAATRKRKSNSTSAGNGKVNKTPPPPLAINKGSQSPAGIVGGIPPLPVNVPAALGILGLASAHPDINALSKEQLMMLKQQQEMMLKSEALQALTAAGKIFEVSTPPTQPPPPPSILLQAAAAQQQQTSPKGATSSSSKAAAPSPSPVAAAAATPVGGALAHFVCEGCGIKFKSVTNLQAHQARYCAGLRKAEEMNAFEALLKRTQHQQQQLPQQPSPLAMSAAEMMSFLNNKSIEHQQQAAAKAAAAAAVAAAAAANSPAENKDQSLASTSGGKAGSTGEDFCCILCGYKEQSVERLKDHINMHFIGHVKKPASATETSTTAPPRLPSTPLPPKSTSSSPASAQEKENSGDSTSASPPLKKRIKLEFSDSASVGSAEETPSAGAEDKHLDEEDPLKIHTPKEESEEGASSPPLGGGKKGPVAVPPLRQVSPVQETSIRCESCDIGFAHLSNFLAHKKYYCQGSKSADAAAPVGSEKAGDKTDETATAATKANGRK